MAVQNSINTNPGVFVALRTLISVNRDLDVSPTRVSTGLKVSGALDDASNFSIAQTKEPGGKATRLD
jgi:flagellin